MKRKDWIAAVAVALVSASAEARVTRVVISSQQVVAGGAPFGDRGPTRS